LEIGFDYGLLNDTVDILNLKSKTLKKISNKNIGAIGDYKEYGLTLNYGISLKSMLSLQLKKRYLDYGAGTLKFFTYDYSFRKSFNSILSLEFGYKGNIADNLKMDDLSSMSYYLKKVDPTLSFEINDKFIIVKKEVQGSTVEVGFKKKENPYIKLKNMKDSTKYIRVTLGKTFEYFYPNMFLEYGHTDIKSEIDSNLKNIVPSAFTKYLPQLPISLDRTEWYYKYGFSLFFRTPFKTLTSLQYSYIKINRKKSLSYMDNNHILDFKIGYFLSKRIILNFHAKYLKNQFNGEVPFLYNKYTQTTFDHQYGWVGFGVTYLWH
jgi:hypothetical protein